MFSRMELLALAIAVLAISTYYILALRRIDRPLNRRQKYNKRSSPDVITFQEKDKGRAKKITRVINDSDYDIGKTINFINACHKTPVYVKFKSNADIVGYPLNRHFILMAYSAAAAMKISDSSWTITGDFMPIYENEDDNDIESW